MNLLDQNDGMTADGLATSHRANVLAGFGLDVDRRLANSEQPGQVGSHGRLVRSELRFLGMDDHVAIDRRPSRERKPIDNLCQESGTVKSAPFRVSIRIVLPDVSQSSRAEEGVGNGMTNDIGVGMPGKASRVVDPQAR